MNWQDVPASWEEVATRIRQQWTRLSASDIEGLDGSREQLIDILMKRYALPREDIATKLDVFIAQM